MEENMKIIHGTYAEGLQKILSDYEHFCTSHELEDVDIQLERMGDVVDVTYVISPSEVDTIEEVYEDYLYFANEIEEELELTEVSLLDNEYYAEYQVKFTYVLRG